ncbi:MAG: SGNH/GDSL hydrolase family protein [Bacteroidales bacterium]|jgi:lysophospholipase L1-like esterase|nr:SGNH/GDSL hydrolase family protein [Bacteroidales bacterium]
MNKLLISLTLAAALGAVAQARSFDRVTTWATALQVVEPHNIPPEPGLAGNSLRQIVQISIGGKDLQLRLSNYYTDTETEILGVEIARAKTMGSGPEIDEASTVELTFDGQRSFSMMPGVDVVSDPVRFKTADRENLAITIHYGKISTDKMTGHPGSRTTSWIATGNTTDFSAPAARTDHWYTVSAIDVKPRRRKAAAVAVLGDSITDGRGTTTNGQDRWTDQLSRSLLKDRRTRHLAVLNFGLGGNCVLRGGLGPTGLSRYRHDLLQVCGVRYIILFEGTNDLGGSQDALQTANGIQAAWTQIAQDAHERGIKVFGATVTPFKGNGYYSEDHERGRQQLNDWIRSSGVFDGVIDFDRLVADPQDPVRLDPAYLYENDWLHLNAQGYEVMGRGIDRRLFY